MQQLQHLREQPNFSSAPNEYKTLYESRAQAQTNIMHTKFSIYIQFLPLLPVAFVSAGLFSDSIRLVSNSFRDETPLHPVNFVLIPLSFCLNLIAIKKGWDFYKYVYSDYKKAHEEIQHSKEQLHALDACEQHQPAAPRP